jgi:hypothetical protein
VRTGFLLVLGLIGLVAGCGGGGGGGGSTTSRDFGDACVAGTPNGSFRYVTRWGNAPAQASQVVQILDAAGGVVRSESLNRTSGAASSSLNLTNVPAGVYEVRARLFSGPNASGVETGQASVKVDLCTTAPDVRTVVGSPVAQVSVSPATRTLREQQSQRFFPTHLASDGSAVFAPVGSVTWSAIGGIGTVSAQGTFTATSAGNGSVRAQSSAGPVGAAPVRVNEFNVTRSKWTVLVYMNAANDLAPASTLNMNQMERVAQNSDVRFVVQWKQSRDAFANSTFDGVRRYVVKPDLTNAIASELVQADMRDSQGRALDMGQPGTLRDFIDWGLTFYPADRTVLVLWSHGNGWQRRPDQERGRAVSYDDQYGTAIQIWDIDTALGGRRFDIVAFDASLMQQLEVAYEFRDYAELIVGSEESPPADGYPYDDVFRKFRDEPEASTADLSAEFVRAMVQNPAYRDRKITQSVLESSRLPSLVDAVSDLGAAMRAAGTQMDAVSPDVRAQAQAYSPTQTRTYRDLGHVCRLLVAHPQVPATVAARAQEVLDALGLAVVHEGHNNLSANSSGVSVDFSSRDVFPSLRTDYIRLQLARDAFWDEWLAVAP